MNGRYRWVRFWPLLLPAAYLVHLAEEIWGGPGFVTWAARYLSDGFTERQFLVINSIAWPAMLIATLVGIYRSSHRWVIITIAVILLINGLLHLGSTILTNSYSPGLFSGVLLYLPLTVLSLRHARRELPAARFFMAAALGAVIHAFVAFMAFGINRL